MAGILGYALELGPEVPRPIPYDWTLSWPKVEEGRRAWAEAITEAVRYHDAWALICQWPNGDLELRDVLTPGAVREATRTARVFVLVGREVRP